MQVAPLVRAKLSPPVPPTGAVLRSRVTEQLARPASLTAIVAPPGYGKTVAAHQLLERLAAGGATGAWLALDPADSEPVRFWNYVAASLAHAGVASAELAIEMLTDGPTVVSEAALAIRAAVEAHDRPVVLVLDDMHHIACRAVHQALDEWLRHPVDQFRLVAVSRAELPLSTGRLRSQGRLTEAHVADLSFTLDESSRLLSDVYGVERLTETQLGALGSRTEGWPVGIALAGLALRDEPDADRLLEEFTGDTRHLMDYLDNEATQRLSDHERAFVLATSIVPVLIPDLCDALTGMPGSLRILRDLAARSVFTSALDPTATTFRYHPLFREHLLSALAAEHGDQLEELHRRAADWYEHAGDFDAAIHHALDANATERAAEMIADAVLPMSHRGQFGTIKAWVERLDELGATTSRIAMFMAWSILNLRVGSGLESWLDKAIAVADTPLDLAVARTQRATVLAHHARHVGDMGEMLRWSELAESEAQHESLVELELREQAELGRGAALSVAGASRYWGGEIGLADSLLRESLVVSRAAGMSIEMVFCQMYLALVAADREDFDEALAMADAALVLADGGERYHLPSAAHLARSHALAGQGRLADAEAALDHARRISAIRSEPMQEIAIEVQQARLAHRRGDQKQARAALREARSKAEAVPDSGFEERLRVVENEIRFVARDAPDLPPGARELTDREQAVLAMLPHGLSRRELAEQLFVSENTVKTHLTAIRHKLGVSGRASIVDRARALGLLTETESTERNGAGS